MPKRSVRDAAVKGKRVLVRVDFNVPIDRGVITDDTRIQAALPTIQLLRERGAKIILCTHLGRPKGKVNLEFSLEPVAERLSQLVHTPIILAHSVSGPEAEAAIAGLGEGDIVMLDNVRFDPGEEKNDPALSERLAKLADIYVNDAFGAAHRAHASTAGVATLLPAYAGLLMESEINALSRLLADPERPFVAILGGAKVSDKLAVIEHLLDKVDTLLIGGGMANTFLLAEGTEIGASLAERDLVEKAREIAAAAKKKGVTLMLPSDAVVASSIDRSGSTVTIDRVPDGQAIFDIGPATIASFAEIIAKARTIFWNGPMGVFEKPAFNAGTKGVAEAVAASNGFSVVGGGDSVAAIEQLGLADKIGHISTGGGASLEFVEGRVLPGIAAIPDEEKN
jgi:phosphoglycerate kinase